MLRPAAVVLVLVFVLSVPLVASAQVYPPRPGVDMPQAYFDRVRKDPTAFRFQRAWIQKAQRVRERRERYIAEKGFYNRQMLTPGQALDMSVAGTVRVPVFCVKFSNTGANPYPVSTLQTKLFDGPYAPETLTQFYDEVSYGNVSMTGNVYGWFQLANPDTFYEGGCQGLCASAKIGDLITETLDAYDGSVDFGLYDNDGPDGIPNSGDDDGFVDFAAFVQPEVGGECGTSNIWSHRWVLSGWTGSPWQSNDPAAGGGYIKVDDYVIQPAWNCDGSSVIDIGVFAHEFGHAFGLPDLYDTNGGSQGIGHWGLMGSGNWNTPTTPAHMGSWSKAELGWTNLVEVGSETAPYAIQDVETNPTAYRLDVTEERWRRMTDCAIAGSYSMRCGYTTAEGNARHWANGDGYGNNWDETVSRDFSWDGNTPVTLEYDYSYDSEPNYDYTYGKIDVNGTVSTFAAYTGTGAGHASIDLSPYLSGTGASSYTVSFEFASDYGWSDEDGFNGTSCGPFVLDNVSVSGGGESYFTDFETREDGWAPDMTNPPEYYLVENRQAVGSDVAVHGGGGLVVWHIDNDVAHYAFSDYGGNTGGPNNDLPRGVAVVQADGLEQLLNNINRGDGGDPYPGSTNNLLLDNATTPNSLSYTGEATNVYLALTSGNGDPITADMRGGWPLPTFASVAPDTGTAGQVVQVTIDGAGFVKGATAALVQGVDVIAAAPVEWVGKDRLAAGFDLNGAATGSYDVVVTNPGGGHVTAPSAFTVDATATAVGSPEKPTAYSLGQNYPNPFNPRTVIPFTLKERAHATLTIYNLRGQAVRTLVDDTLNARAYSVEWDGRNQRGETVASGVYFYKLVAGPFRDVRKLVVLK